MFRDILRVVSILSVLVLVLLVTPGRTAQHPLLKTHGELISVSHSKNDFILSKTIYIDVSYTTYDAYLAVYENVGSSLFPEGISGGVKFVRGDYNQPENCGVFVQVSSPTSEGLDSISITNDTRSVYVNSTGPGPSNPQGLVIYIIIFIQPETMQSRYTNIWTANLDIDIFYDLWFETYHMSLYTIGGNITGTDNHYYFTAHEISISTEYGSILGNWAFPTTISFYTGNGDIDINLAHKIWSSGYSTSGDLTALAKRGNIDIRMPFAEGEVELRNGTAVISARQGSITGAFVHGAITELLAHGSINVTLLPYWAFSDWQGIAHNWITTYSRVGNTTVTVLPPIMDTYYGVNSLFFTFSNHTQVTGSSTSMNLIYPGEWGGVATGYSGSGGSVFVKGEDFAEVVRNSTTVVVERPPPGGSRLYFEVDMGLAELRLDACASWDCSGLNAEPRPLDPDR